MAAGGRHDHGRKSDCGFVCSPGKQNKPCVQITLGKGGQRRHCTGSRVQPEDLEN